MNQILRPAPAPGAAPLPAGAPLPSSPHRLYEDAAALLMGCFMVGMGLTLYGEARIVTSGLAGLALLMGFATPLDPGSLFFLLNLPFLALGWRRMGTRVLVRTVIAIGAVSLLTRYAPALIDIESVSPVYAAVMGGILMGMGVLALMRHRTGLGGINLLAMDLQERRGWRAGTTQMAFDALLLLGACFVLEWRQVALSLLGAAILNLIVALNHKPGRYLGVS